MSCTIFDFGGILMAICYDKLWKLLIDKKMNRTELKEASGISFNVLARLGKNEPVSFESIEKICFTLNCKIEDVVEIKKEESPQIDSDAFTTIELFAGAGGLALGIEKAGFEPLGLIEFDKDAAESLKTNRPNWRVIHDDIANISCLDLEDYFGIKKGDLDLLSGGAPCQAFSYAGKRLGLEDARGTLFYHYATFLQKLQPKMFLFENVRGLLTHDKGRTYATITSIFEQAGYTIQKKVLNAWDFGVPQKRERLITIGIRNDLMGKVSFSFPKEHDYKPVLRDVLLDCPEGPGVPYGENKRKIFELVPPGGYWRDIDPEIRKKENITLYDMDSFRTSETPKELADNLEAAGKIVKDTDSSLLVQLAGIFVVLGHTFPVFFKFKGGKGVATSLGVLLITNWQIGLICLVFALILMALTRFVSLGSIAAAILFPVLTVFIHENYLVPGNYIIFAIIMAILVVFNHRSNVKRLLEGKENKLSFKGTK